MMLDVRLFVLRGKEKSKVLSWSPKTRHTKSDSDEEDLDEDEEDPFEGGVACEEIVSKPLTVTLMALLICTYVCAGN